MSSSELPGQVEQTTVFKYYVWGEVQTPGAYRLGSHPDIIELLSAGGGPTEQADLTRVTLIQGIDQRRERVNLRQALSQGKARSLSPGDVVIIPRSFWYRFREEIALVSSLAVFVNLYFTIANSSKGNAR